LDSKKLLLIAKHFTSGCRMIEQVGPNAAPRFR